MNNVEGRNIILLKGRNPQDKHETQKYGTNKVYVEIQGQLNASGTG
jgi:hypothetical protein